MANYRNYIYSGIIIYCRNSDSKLKYSDLIADINSGKVESIQVESDGKKPLCN